MKPEILCNECNKNLIDHPGKGCPSVNHWEIYAAHLERQMEMHDDDRDKLDVAEWLEHYEKVRSYDCRSCSRHYEIPTHLTHLTCVCGQRVRLRHLGGTDPDAAVIDAAIRYFGTERMAQLAYIAEVIAGPHCYNYTADQIREMFRREMDRWILEDDGWRKKNGQD